MIRDAIGHGRTSVLCAVLHYEATHGYGPSVRHLAEATGLALSTVQQLRLRKMGLVAWTTREQRTLHSTVAVVVPS